MDAAEKPLEALLLSINACRRQLESSSEDFARIAGRYSADIERDVRLLEETIEQVTYELRQGYDVGNYSRAFKNATDKIEQIVSEEPYSHLDIRILAVAASFSWDWISKELLPLLREPNNRNVRCDIQMLLVDPNYIPFIHAGFKSKDVPWHTLSAGRVAEAEELVSSLEQALRERFRLSIVYYENLPHWHGVLIQNSYLYLGRTNWVGSHPNFHMRVGENAYREYDRSAQNGVDRLDVFNSWFTYYSSIGRTGFSHGS